MSSNLQLKGAMWLSSADQPESPLVRFKAAPMSSEPIASVIHKELDGATHILAPAPSLLSPQEFG
jgi:hypothetical protein